MFYINPEIDSPRSYNKKKTYRKKDFMYYQKQIPKWISIFVLFALCFSMITPVYASTDIENSIIIPKTENHTELQIEFIPMPAYNQYDYPETPYMGKTVAERGCGITCASMIATYLLQNEELTPEYLALTYGDRNNKHPEINYNSLMSVTTSTLNCLGIKTTLTFSFDKAVEALMEDKIVLSLENPGLFTTVPNGHFVVFKEITEDCRFIIHDPNGYHWEEYDYYFEKGFPYWSVYDTGSGYWICEVEEIEEDCKG